MSFSFAHLEAALVLLGATAAVESDWTVSANSEGQVLPEILNRIWRSEL